MARQRRSQSNGKSNPKRSAALPELDIDFTSERVTKRLDRIAENYAALDDLLASLENRLPDTSNAPPQGTDDSPAAPRKPR